MTMLRNGKASIVQLLAADFSANTSFTIPDTGLNSPGGSANATNSFAGGIAADARYKAIAVGSDATAEAALQTGLGAEYTTIGLTRRSGVDVRTYLIDETGPQGAWTSVWETTFTASGSGDVNELSVANKTASKEGLALMRQKLANTLKVVAGDLLNVVLRCRIPGTNSVGTPPANQAVVTFEGLREICRLIMDTGSTRTGEDGGAGDWRTDYTIGGVASRNERQFDAMACGSAGLARTLSRDDVELDTEHTTADLDRENGTSIRGTLMQAPAVSPPGTVWDGSVPGNQATSFGADTFTTFAGDTVQWAVRWDLSTTRTVNETGTFNGHNPAGVGPAPDDPGVMLLEFVEIDNTVGDENLSIIRIHRLVCV